VLIITPGCSIDMEHQPGSERPLEWSERYARPWWSQIFINVRLASYLFSYFKSRKTYRISILEVQICDSLLPGHTNLKSVEYIKYFPKVDFTKLCCRTYSMTGTWLHIFNFLNFVLVCIEYSKFYEIIQMCILRYASEVNNALTQAPPPKKKKKKKTFTDTLTLSPRSWNIQCTDSCVTFEVFKYVSCLLVCKLSEKCTVINPFILSYTTFSLARPLQTICYQLTVYIHYHLCLQKKYKNDQQITSAAFGQHPATETSEICQLCNVQTLYHGGTWAIKIISRWQNLLDKMIVTCIETIPAIFGIHSTVDEIMDCW
jgi:hypothetical protein